MDREERAVLEDAFIAGFRDAPDKRAFLALARVPMTLLAPDCPALKLLEVRLDDHYRVGSAAPGFGTRELAYQPLPGALVTRSTKLTFVYVSTDEVLELTLHETLQAGDTHAPGHAKAPSTPA